MEQQRWWLAYREHPDWGLKRLAAHVKANIHRVKHAVRHGWPELKMQAFQDRLIAMDAAGAMAGAAVVREIQTQAIVQAGRSIAKTWEDAAQDQVAMLQHATDAIRKISASIDKVAEHANFMSYRRVPDIGPDGQIRRDERGNAIMIWRPYHNGLSMAAAVGKLSEAGKNIAMLGKVLLSATAPPVGMPDADGARDHSHMTDMAQRARLKELLDRGREFGVEGDEPTAKSG